MRQFIGTMGRERLVDSAGAGAAGSVGDEPTVRDLLVAVAPRPVRKAADDLARAELVLVEVDDEPAQMAYAQALVDWADAGGYDYEVLWDVCTVAALGIPFEKTQWRTTDTLSGGEQKRLALEALLLFEANDAGVRGLFLLLFFFLVLLLAVVAVVIALVWLLPPPVLIAKLTPLLLGPVPNEGPPPNAIANGPDDDDNGGGAAPGSPTGSNCIIEPLNSGNCCSCCSCCMCWICCWCMSKTPPPLPPLAATFSRKKSTKCAMSVSVTLSHGVARATAMPVRPHPAPSSITDLPK